MLLSRFQSQLDVVSFISCSIVCHFSLIVKLFVISLTDPSEAKLKWAKLKDKFVRERNVNNKPSGSSSSDIREIRMPYCIVADEAFPLMINLMRPYPGRATGVLPLDKKVFNYRWIWGISYMCLYLLYLFFWTFQTFKSSPCCGKCICFVGRPMETT